MSSHSQHNEDARVDPALDQLLRDVTQRPALSDEQHARIRARIGLPVQSTSSTRTAVSGSARREVVDRRRSATTTRLNVEREEPEEVHMATRFGQRNRSQWLELAAVLAVVLVAVVALAVFRSQQDNVPQQGSVPLLPTATATATVPTTPTPEVVAVLPTPDAGGMYRGVTADQARALVPFALQLPGQIPDGFAEPVISVSETAVDGSAEPTWVVTLMLVPDASPATEPLEYLQTNGARAEAPAGRAITAQLAGTEVTRTLVTIPGDRAMLFYTWEIDGVFSSVSALTSETLPESLVDQFVASIFGLEGDPFDDTGDLLPEQNAEGIYVNLQPNEVRRLVPLPLLFAEATPAGFSDPAISVEIVKQSDTGETLVYVDAVYDVVVSPQPDVQVEYIQSNQRPQNPPGGDMSVIELGGRAINKALITGDDAPTLLIYTWQERGTFATVSARLGDALTEEQVESLVAAIVATAPEQHAASETVSSNGIAIAIESVSFPEQYEGTAAPEGMRHVVVRGEYANEGNQLVDIARHLDAQLIDASGWTFLPEVASLATPATELRPGQTATFELAFVVPQGDSTLSLVFSPSADRQLDIVFMLPQE
jgi:hypothetical protein